MSAGAGVIGIAMAAPADAATVTVNCPANDLQSAINGAAPGSTIVVRGTCTGSFSISTSLTLVGPATLNGVQLGVGSTVLTVGGGAAVTLNSITVQGGGGEDYGAAGIDNGLDGSASSLTLNNSSVVNNNPYYGGDGHAGGIYNNATLILNSSSVANNYEYTINSDVAKAGGILNDVEGTLIVNKSSVSGNTSELVGAGGIFNLGTDTISNSQVSRNSLFLGAYSQDPTVGGIENWGFMTLDHTSVLNNSGRNGNIGVGGIENTFSLTLNKSTVSSNYGGLVGGINVVPGPGESTTLNHTSVTNNMPGQCVGVAC
jgi:hypothetical protein